MFCVDRIIRRLSREGFEAAICWEARSRSESNEAITERVPGGIRWD